MLAYFVNPWGGGGGVEEEEITRGEGGGRDDKGREGEIMRGGER